MKAMTEIEKNWAVSKYKKGYTHQQIADALYVSRVTITNLLKGVDRGLPPLETPEQTVERLRKAIKRDGG